MSLNIKQKQTLNIVMITFWSQFSSYALNAILILFLTRPLLEQGLGFSQAQAYSFMGISNATGYLMPILGGYVADRLLGLRRSILFGGCLLAFVYLLIMLSGYFIPIYGREIFIATYALVPACSSLLMGTASGMVTRIYDEDIAQAKVAMTYYYMAINVGALLSIFIAPSLLDSQFGPLSVLALTFIGKSIAAINFAYRYRIYDAIATPLDRQPLTWSTITKLILYLISIYMFTLCAYNFVDLFSIIISIGCIGAMSWFLIQTLFLESTARLKQFIACLLIFEAIVFFIIYNQMNSTLILFAQHNSDSHFLGISVSPAQYQLINPLLIILIGSQLSKFYHRFPRFYIPYQFAIGTLLAGLALLTLAFASFNTQTGLINGNFIAITYILITLAELFVSAIGLSMIGLYCHPQTLGFAMGAWYLGSSISNILSGKIAHWVALPEKSTLATESISIFSHYYFSIGIIAVFAAILMLFVAFFLQKLFAKRKIGFA
jgi:proton-dependent oligopeptide transporter, POT family